MDAWSNIEVSADDPEITSIDRMEQALGSLPHAVYEVRALIMRFEVCHFKYQKHYAHIVRSIGTLQPDVPADRIGDAHPRNGEKAAQSDTTGRSLAGLRYINAMRFWRGHADGAQDDAQNEMNRRVASWLGERNNEKDKLVQMLLDRLLYRFEGCDYQQMTGLAYQVMRTDICCYGFPGNVEKMLRAIGTLSPVADFEGCGTANDEIRRAAGRRLRELCRWLREDGTGGAAVPGEKTPAKVWLAACLAKTIKAQIQASDPIPGLPQ